MYEGIIQTTVFEEQIKSYWIRLSIKTVRAEKLMRGRCIRVTLIREQKNIEFIRPLARRDDSLSVTIPMPIAKRLDMKARDVVWYTLMPLDHVNRAGETIELDCNDEEDMS